MTVDKLPAGAAQDTTAPPLPQPEQRQCCATLAAALAPCADHPDPFECSDAVIVETSTGKFGMPIRDGGRSCFVVRFCPFCGASLEARAEGAPVSIADLGLGRRLTNMLMAWSIQTVDELCLHNARWLRRINGMGAASFVALGRALHRVGRRLAPPLRQDHAESLTAWLRTCGADELAALGLREPGHGAPAPRRTR